MIEVVPLDSQPDRNEIANMRVGTTGVDGIKVRQLRTRQGWTQDDLARKSGCSKKTIENVEAGRPVLHYTVNCLALALNVARAELLLQEETLPPNPPRLTPQATPEAAPFCWRTAITQPDAFFNRDHEQQLLQKYIRDGQSCQIVGPRRIGKSSLLRQIERAAPRWRQGALVAYVDLQNPRCFTLAGFLDHVGRQLGLAAGAFDLVQFSERLDDLLAGGTQPILCLDEFEELIMRRQEFTRDFFAALRFCGQKPVSIITASQKRLHELLDPGDPSSPFYNIFPPLELSCFDDSDAADFVALRRAGVPGFTSQEKKGIGSFASGHPLALQVACFHVLEARASGDDWTGALARAQNEMEGYVPAGWTAAS
jgi:transcriptional regulator with XRE-family HTH domain